ncbi:MAG TPA: hypothetical protein VLF94_01605 [Chlamydiales bacterium]|nr:hypothetical protein [Chlamydiales bacterium]
MAAIAPTATTRELAEELVQRPLGKEWAVALTAHRVSGVLRTAHTQLKLRERQLGTIRTQSKDGRNTVANQKVQIEQERVRLYQMAQTYASLVEMNAQDVLESAGLTDAAIRTAALARLNLSEDQIADTQASLQELAVLMGTSESTGLRGTMKGTATKLRPRPTCCAIVTSALTGGWKRVAMTAGLALAVLHNAHHYTRPVLAYGAGLVSTAAATWLQQSCDPANIVTGNFMTNNGNFTQACVIR